jgi:large subunit ribosomal protein L13
MGDNVIVINARRVVLKGAKIDQKLYRHHTRYPGGLREVSARNMFAKRPERVLELAIKGMLPKNKLGKAMGKKLKIYADGEHPHTAQRPQPHEFTSRSNQQ